MRHLVSIPLLALAAACSSNAAADMKPSGVNGARSFDLKGFDSVSLAGPDTVIVQVGKAASIRAVGDTGLIDQLEIKVDNGDLSIGRKKSGWLSGNHHGKGVTITVTLPAMTGASVAGSGDMDVDTVSGAGFDVSIAGSGSLKVATLKADRLKVSIAGSGDAAITGTAGTLDISIAGSGDLDAAALNAQTADISIAGSGSVKAGVSGNADVSIIGSGDADITGGATCKINKIGSGDVRCTGGAAQPAPAAS